MTYPDATKTPFGDRMVNSSGIDLEYGDLVVIDGLQAGEDTSQYDLPSSYIFRVTVPQIDVGEEYQAHTGLFRVVTEPNGILAGAEGRCAGRETCIADLKMTYSGAQVPAQAMIVAEDNTTVGGVAATPTGLQITGRKVVALVLIDTGPVSGATVIAPVLFNGDQGFGKAGDPTS